MLISKYILVFLFVLVGLGVFNPLQSQNKYKQGVLVWEKIKGYDIFSKKEVPFLSFTDGVFKDNLPVAFIEGWELISTGAATANVTLVSAAYEIISGEEINIVQNIKEIKDSIIITSEIKVDNKQNYVFYTFLPVRKNPVTGNYERLTNYVMGFSESRLKSSAQMSQSFSYQDNSVLQSGNWFSFKVNKTGVYQVFYNELKDLGLTNPANVKIYGNGGGMLPEKFAGNKIDDLKELPIYLVTGADGVFNSGDYLLVYLQGPVVWKWDAVSSSYVYSQHSFTDEICYFITEGASGKRVEMAESPVGNISHQVNSYDHYDFVDNNLRNLIGSGREWYGEEFSLQNSQYDFYFDLPNLISGENINIHSEILARSGITTSVRYLSNSTLFYSSDITSTNVLNNEAQYAIVNNFKSSFKTNSGRIKLTIQYLNKGDLGAKAWLNFIRLWTRQNLKISGGQLQFRDMNSVGDGNISNFIIDGANNQMLVWDVTDFHNIKQHSTTFSENKLSFIASSSNLKYYIAFDPRSNLLRPVLSSSNRVANQNLHALNNLEFVIVTHPLFIKQAEELAEIHRKNDGITAGVFTINQVYNEFSSGNPDLAAIRDFVKMLYDKAPDTKSRPKNLLLFGDGSVNPKPLSVKNPNYILTYQSISSLWPISSYVSDDYYGLLDNNEDIETGRLDIGVGRFPVQDTVRAQGIIEKIKKYYLYSAKGDWRNIICFIGDDDEHNLHSDDADRLARYVEQNHPNFNIDKIYLDAYQQIATSSGQQCPDAKTAIYNRLYQGALIMNYSGHGNENGLSGEQIITQKDDIIYWKNAILPFWVTATCEFSRYDDVSRQTGGEDILLNPDGGGIGLFSTTRLVYPGPNYILNNNFYKNAFVRDSLGKQLTIGEIIQRAKNSSGSEYNKLKFALLGDPALRLAYPLNFVKTDSINGKEISTIDTLRAYQEITLSGSIRGFDNNIIENFNGVLQTKVFDKAKRITNLSNDGQYPFYFNQQKDILFKGQASVKNGNFRFSFILPRDMDYNFGQGRISFYAADSLYDASGYFKDVIIGGLYPRSVIDNNGPDIELFINDINFKNGGITNEYPILLARISDENGINIGGNGIGHDIVAVLDNNTSKQILLNSFFQASIDNFRSGELKYQLSQLEPGLHTISVKAWDIYNNSSVSQISFRVVNGKEPKIENLKLYPNPWNRGVMPVTLNFEHNINNKPFNITINVYDMTGALVASIKQTMQTSGFTSGPIELDSKGFASQKLSKGMYLVRVIMDTANGQVQSEAKKLIITE